MPTADAPPKLAVAEKAWLWLAVLGIGYLVVADSMTVATSRGVPPRHRY